MSLPNNPPLLVSLASGAGGGVLAVVGGVWAVGTGLGAAAVLVPVEGVAGIGLGGKAGAAAAPLGAPAYLE